VASKPLTSGNAASILSIAVSISSIRTLFSSMIAAVSVAVFSGDKLNNSSSFLVILIPLD
jgi:hypothetical protein